ncbi:uncharacterized protein LDX57_005676 [Aspergillus melleus]|uniref:uncharacterized protein n=1 Tax=Aspergillus melleus TaxID=138277 RepID=UPI001E8CAE27|nr:uncharacterized protein LDX57_005676 [Aspergillus melleus]KAH8427970.1 hypothetical protein LDX57_005676 [Aspergillus melleus]
MRFSIPEAQFTLQNIKVALSAFLLPISKVVGLETCSVSFRCVKSIEDVVHPQYQEIIAVFKCDRPVEIGEEDDLRVGLHIRKSRITHGHAIWSQSRSVTRNGDLSRDCIE